MKTTSAATPCAEIGPLYFYSRKTFQLQNLLVENILKLWNWLFITSYKKSYVARDAALQLHTVAEGRMHIFHLNPICKVKGAAP